MVRMYSRHLRGEIMQTDIQLLERPVRDSKDIHTDGSAEGLMGPLVPVVFYRHVMSLGVAMAADT